MTHWRRMGKILAAAVTLAGVAALLPPATEAHGRGGFRRGPRVHFGGFYGFYGFPYYAFGYGPFFGPYLGPYAYGPPGGLDLNVALLAGVGGIDLNVKPGQAEVWVDGKYTAEARDLDGYPSFLWLPEGVHRLVVYKGGYARFEEEVEVQRGVVKELKVRLEEGDSEPPGQRPGKAS